jgi:hypothetical protein
MFQTPMTAIMFMTVFDSLTLLLLVTSISKKQAAR